MIFNVNKTFLSLYFLMYYTTKHINKGKTLCADYH